jgi:hypothetical protein
MPPELTTGWDVGGAHLKVAQVEGAGCVRKALQLPCTLWRGMEHLDHAIAQARAALLPARRHGVTMTGELTDLFVDRVEGVSSIAPAMRAPSRADAIYSGAAGFVRRATLGDIRANRLGQLACERASSRHATLSRLSSHRQRDDGPRPVRNGEVCAAGMSDDERLTAELRYRRPYAGLASGTVPFAGHMHPLMAELFATAAGGHRLTGALPRCGSASARPPVVAVTASRRARPDSHACSWCDRCERRSSPGGPRAASVGSRVRFIHDGAVRMLSRVALERDAQSWCPGVGRLPPPSRGAATGTTSWTSPRSSRAAGA